MKVNAYAAMEAKGDLKSFSYEIKELGPYAVLIDVICSGVCHSDISLIDNEWVNSIYPLVPGHEIVGKVSQVGEKVDKTLIGKRVGMGWQNGACTVCDSCKHEFSHVCVKKTLTCLHRYGGFADKVLGDARFIYLIPEGLASEVAAPLLCAGATVFSPLSQADLPKGTKIAILGVGGLGHLALQFAKALKYHVTAISGSSDKQEEAHHFGADEFLTTAQLKGKEREFDFILSTYKLHENVDTTLSLLAPFGTLCLVTRESINLATSSLISFERKLKGTTTASPNTINKMLAFAAHHHIAPQIEKRCPRFLNNRGRRHTSAYRLRSAYCGSLARHNKRQAHEGAPVVSYS